MYIKNTVVWYIIWSQIFIKYGITGEIEKQLKLYIMLCVVNTLGVSLLF